MKFDQRTIDDVKSKADIATVVSQYVPLTKDGSKRFKALCPFHDEKTPSFKVFTDTQTFHCFGCDRYGDVISFVRNINNCGFYEALAILTNGTFPGVLPKKRKSPVTVKKQTTISLAQRIEIYQSFMDSLTSVDPRSPTPGHQWLLENKRIHYSTQASFDIRWLADYGKIKCHMKRLYKPDELRDSGLFNADGNLIFYRHRLIFPFTCTNPESGCLVPYFVQGRNVEAGSKDKRFLCAAGGIEDTFPGFYNADAIATAKQLGREIILCEGITDTLTVAQIGYCAAGVIGNQGLKPAMAKHLKGLKVYIAYDHDHTEAIEKAAQVIVASGLLIPYVLDLPENKDITEFMLEENNA